MKFNTNKKYTSIAIYAFLVIAGAIAFYYMINDFNRVMSFLGGFMGLLSPFIYGAVLAYVLNPVLNWLEGKAFPFIFKDKISKKGRRTIGVICSFLFAATVVAIFLAILIPQIVQSVDSLTRTIYNYIPRVQALVTELVNQYGSNEVANQIMKALGIDSNNIGASLQSWLTSGYDFLTRALPNLLGGVLKITSGLLNWVVGIIISVYLLLSKEVFYAQVKKFLFAFTPNNFASGMLKLTNDSNNIFCGFISGKILDSAIIGVICFAGCYILKMPYTLLVSVIVGVTNVIPYFGPFIGAIPSIFIIIIADPWKALIFAGFVLILQQLDGNIIGPKILGDSTGLSAFWVIFSVTFFGGMFGFIGMVIGVPTFAVIYSLIRNFAEYRLAFKGMETETVAYAAENQPIFQNAKKIKSKKKYTQSFHLNFIEKKAKAEKEEPDTDESEEE